MESSQVFGGAEECHSSESGWTMYIGSPIHAGDDDGDGEPSDNGNNAYDANGHGKNCNHDEDRDDDSMASDASSGPSHQGVADFNHEEEKEDGKHGLERKDKKPVVERQKADRMRRKDDKAEEVLLLAKRGKPPAQSSSKVRKSIWRGKRK